MSAPATQFHIAALVTKADQYDAMKASFVGAGFTPENTRYSVFDNSASNAFEPYSLINKILAESPEPYVILCHQDVRADHGYGHAQLVAAIDQLNKLDSNWAVAGNAGNTDDFNFILRLTDPNNFPLWSGPLPLKVNSLDESFLLFRTAAGTRASASLSGFHLYGTDVCVNARLAGKNSYVIDFVLTHLSAGHFGDDFFRVRKAFIDRWNPEFNFLYLVRGAEIFLTRWNCLRNIGPKVRVKRLLLGTPALRRLMTWELRPRRTSLT